MNKIIAKEVPPCSRDFSIYFDGDCFKASCGDEKYAIYIIGNPRYTGNFNFDEYLTVKNQAFNILEGFDNIVHKYEYAYKSYKACMEDNGITYSSEKCKALFEWAKNTERLNPSDMAQFLSIVTGDVHECKGCHGYSQGEYCDVIYRKNIYSNDAITEIGDLWLGRGTEFCIDDCYGFFVTDDIRWKGGETLINTLAEIYGCKPEELEVQLYIGSHTVDDYEELKIG